MFILVSFLVFRGNMNTSSIEICNYGTFMAMSYKIMIEEKDECKECYLINWAFMWELASLSYELRLL